VAHDDRILSQAEIDSLLRKILPKSDEPVASVQPVSVKPTEPSKPKEVAPAGPAAASVKPTELSKLKESAPAGLKAASVKPTELSKLKTVDTPPTLRPVAATKQESTSDEISSLQKNIADLSREVSKLAVAMQTISQLEERVKQLETSLKLSPDSTRTLKSRIDEISNILEMIQQKKSDYTFFEEYKCSHCQSKNLVAVHVKCTSCGKENWMGWWPDSNKK
jgi:prefoldin subunit 5